MTNESKKGFELLAEWREEVLEVIHQFLLRTFINKKEKGKK